MFGSGPFGSVFGATPHVGTMVFESTGVMAGAATLAGVGSAVASSTGTLALEAAFSGSMTAVFGSTGVMAQSWTMLPKAVSIWNAKGVMEGRADLLPAMSAVRSSTGLLTSAFTMTGYQLRAYDQLFPAQVKNNDIVQIGRRLYQWKANSGRWQPAGPVTPLTVTIELASLFEANLIGASRSIVAIPPEDIYTDLLPVYARNLQPGYSDSLATIPDTDEVADLAEVFESALA